MAWGTGLLTWGPLVVVSKVLEIAQALGSQSVLLPAPVAPTSSFLRLGKVFLDPCGLRHWELWVTLDVQEGPNVRPSAGQSSASAVGHLGSAGQDSCHLVLSGTKATHSVKLTPGMPWVTKAGGKNSFHPSLPTPPASPTLRIRTAYFDCKCDDDNHKVYSELRKKN